MDRLNNLFDNAHDEIFEDGMDTVFSNNLGRIIQDYGEDAIDALDSVMSSPHANVEIIEEALRQVGQIDDRHTHDCRLDLLKRKLGSLNSRIRDAASIGIADMNDLNAITSLQNAICNEPNELVKKNLKAVLIQLQDN